MSGATVAIATLGCRLNQVDSAELQAALEARGFRTVAPDGAADVVVVNTCTVTARAEFSDRQAIHRAVRRNPRARVVVTGCWAQTNPEAVARTASVDLVAGNADKPRLAELIDELLRSPRAGAVLTVSPFQADGALAEAAVARTPNRSRAFLKIQEGCQHRCAFCIVPLARGASRSRAPQFVLDEVIRLVGDGHPEIVLTGVDLGHYGADLAPRTSLAALLAALVQVRGLRWLRLSSLLPAYFTEPLLDLVTSSPAIAPHLHVPLQSGSDRILRRMRRPYTAAMYRRLVERLAAARPGLGLGADVIAGFPGETEADFAATLDLVQALPFSYLHVFPYSDRAGTEAAGMAERVETRVVTERSRRLRDLARAKSLAFRRALVGSMPDALVLETRDRRTGQLVGLTGHYVEVIFDGPQALQRRMTPVRVTAVQGDRTLGAA
jgi:threonylcarbamoyladenosine tRNA methylthiotransferase MtaB